MKMINVRAFQRELEEMGVSPKSVEQRIAEAVARERAACAKTVEEYARLCQEVADDGDMQVLYREVAAGNQYAATKLDEAAAAIRARTEEKTE